MNKKCVDHRTNYETDIDMHIPIIKRPPAALKMLVKVHIIHIHEGQVLYRVLNSKQLMSETAEIHHFLAEPWPFRSPA